MLFNNYMLAFTSLLLASSAQCQRLGYEDSITALAYGNVAANESTPGEVWLNVTGFAPDKLPHIQDNLGIYTFDNLNPLKTVAGLALEAAKRGQYGDVVFLYNAFAVNAYIDNIKVASDEMKEGLLSAVTGQNGTQADPNLVDLYARTSSSKFVADAFDSLKGGKKERSGISRRDGSPVCDSKHQALKSACKSLISSLSGNITWKSGGPRSACKYGCCISWSANATFQYDDLTNASTICLKACLSADVSCKTHGVDLGGTVVNQCMSNRATHCS